MQKFDFLKERGFIFQVSDEKSVRDIFDNPKNRSFYIGYDPTADSLHLGHMVGLMAAKYMAEAGLRPIIIMGGATASVGDPSGKTEMRKLLTMEQIQKNLECIETQIRRILPENSNPIFLNNADWMKDMSMIDYLRNIGRHFSINRMLTQDSVRQRLDSGNGLSYLEFSYMLLQSYDFAYLAKKHDCVLQIGGAEQWGNMVMGMDLARRMFEKEVQFFTFSLVTTSTGEKMGKTASGAVWLDPKKTSSYDYYQYWVNVDDRDVCRLLKYFTFLPTEEINEMTREGGSSLNKAKQVLAYEATKLLHGQAEAEKAMNASKALFSGDASFLEGVPVYKILDIKLTAGVNILDLLVDSKLSPSKSDARRLIDGGGVYVNNERIDSATFVVKENVLIRVGKKKFMKIEGV